MSEHLVPAGEPSPFGGSALQQWEEPSAQLPAIPTSPIDRPVAAVRRYKWLMLAIIVLAAAAGFLTTRLVTPKYEVHASIVISTQSQAENQTGPIRSSELLGQDDWTQLLTTYSIADAVVRQLSLYLKPADLRVDGQLFTGFGLAERFQPGKYSLAIDKNRGRWVLSTKPSDAAIDSGGVADSVGRALGFLWQVPAFGWTGSGVHKADFTVVTPREVAVQLTNRIGISRRPGSDFLSLTYQDPNPQLAANILNTWTREFISVAASLKKRKLVEFANTLDGQLHTSKSSLDSAEINLSSFRVNTITQPSEGAPIAAGIQETRDPVIKNYFDKQLEYDDVKHDAQLLQGLVGNISHDSVPGGALLQIRSVATGDGGAQLRSALADYNATAKELATARIGLQEAHPTVRNLVAKLNTLKTQAIPLYANELLKSLRAREIDDSTRIASAGANLQKIPQRTIEEERYRRARDVAAGLYTNLQNRFAEAQLAEASATPDVSIMDSAIAPLSPTTNTAPKLMLMAIVGGIGAAFALALLLDRLDGRIRYPEQVTDELGLAIAGTVPLIPRRGVNKDSPEQVYQIVESFRTLRMVVTQAASSGPIAVAVSSPSPSEGKSLISANLAMSFADAGLRTVLVDGDTRRGALHTTFGIGSVPGLTDYLSGSIPLEDVLRETGNDVLWLLPCGMRQRRSPELLTSGALPALIAELRARFDVVIVDTPPMAAGIDSYSLAAATGSLLVVLRIGQTARRMTAEKLRAFQRLPVDIIGGVLNGVQLQGTYGYYEYVAGYEAEDEAPGTSMVPTR
jgi:capsular exopolysaccharide synthesis family protein